MACRLIQPEAAACRECNGTVMSALDQAGDLLRFRWDPADRQPREPARHAEAKANARRVGVLGSVGAVTGMSVLGVLGYPLLLIPAVAGSVVLTAGFVTAAVRRRRTSVVPVPLYPAVTSAGAETRSGIAHKLIETVTSIGDRVPVLAQEVTVQSRGGVFFRTGRTAPFSVELDDGATIVIAGVVRIATRTAIVRVRADDPRLAELGIPRELGVSGKLHTCSVRDGDRVTVTGELSREVMRELAFHRDGGEASVMRGRSRAVVIVGAAGST